jgi:hypothetical protein
VSQLLERVCFALGRDGSRGGIIDACIVGDRLFIRGLKHRILHVPLDSIRSLRGHSRAAVRNFSVDPHGTFISAITALARAHGLDANAYKERLTKVMR